MAENGAPLEETNSSGSLPSKVEVCDATAVEPSSLFGRKGGILIAITGLLIIVIIIASTTLALFAAFHRTTLATPTPPQKSVATLASSPGAPGASYPSYLPGHGSLVFADSLNGTGAQTWKPAIGCTYSQGRYQVTSTMKQPLYVCLGPALNNFAFEVQMTIIQGDCGGIVFRGDMKNNVFYNYMVCALGVFSLAKYVGNNPGVSLIQPTSNQAINGDVNQSNTLAIYAQGNSIILYANGKRLGQILDNASAKGLLGLDSVSLVSNATKVAYSNARAWSL
ncbi:MAG TPA: hypothetical protein VKV40_14670 [Ktedonobacteraceae bacterium]|nr:hypothetical protein [Ktedonobacteraceae bacterium]